MRDQVYDAVVVGAGPAGSATARDIAAKGFRTLLLEEHGEIGKPRHCSGLITPRTLELAGTDPGIVLNELRGGFVNVSSGARLCLDGQKVHAVAVDRVQFDRQLARHAQEKGADLQPHTRLVAIERENKGLLLSLNRKGRRQVVATRLLVGADGAQSLVAKWMGAKALQNDTMVGLGAEVKLKTERQDFVEVFLGNSIAPGFFAWIIPLAEGYARLGIATNDGKRPIHYLRDLMNAFPNFFAGAEVERYYGGLIALKRLARIYGDNVMLVGDAAGQVKPTSGGGIYAALIGARQCAEVATLALAQGDLSALSLSRYQAMWQSGMGGELDRGWDLRRAFLSLNDSDLARLTDILRSPRIRSLISRYGDIDYPSQLALRLAMRRPLLLGFAKVALAGPWWPLLRRSRHSA